MTEKPKDYTNVAIAMLVGFLAVLYFTGDHSAEKIQNQPISESAAATVDLPVSRTGWEKYGITEAPSDQQIAEDQKYGGYPNNRYFNNDTKCSTLVEWFATDAHPERATDFFSYASMSLAQTDILEQTRHRMPSLLDMIGPAQWSSLPASYVPYCRQHPRRTLGEATIAIYEAVLFTQPQGGK